MTTINTNLLSINAQRNLQSTQGALATSIQRLSSGLRINSAKDDAAGLAISERFSTQIRGLNVAVRNANDGISLAQTAEGALSSIGNNLQRIRELAVQSSNATNSSTDREALQKEVDQLISEIQRVATQTEFNGTKLLDGSFTGQAFQVGANAGQLISVSSIANAQTSSLGGTLFAGGTITIAEPADANTAINLTGIKIGGVDLDDISVPASGTTAAATQTAAVNALVSAINERAAELGVVASASTTPGVVDVSSFVAGDAALDVLITGATASFAAPTAETFVSSVNVSSFAGAQRAIAIMDTALTTVNTARADLGAIQNRFSSVVQNLQINAENLSASRSRILDADFAAETAALSRAQILQQAGTAMVAQANQLPQGVLALLR
ncbi:flagellin [Tepidicella baoligensis]|uniref:flagellin n=1 Tax=Tepidicella baoligensis TaxID=2707016 RepID=UPI0015DA0867|nr:flagellin [Tepidicella baoligensis]